MLWKGLPAPCLTVRWLSAATEAFCGAAAFTQVLTSGGRLYMWQPATAQSLAVHNIKAEACMKSAPASNPMIWVKSPLSSCRG